jgi:hypothetical protein
VADIANARAMPIAPLTAPTPANTKVGQFFRLLMCCDQSSHEAFQPGEDRPHRTEQCRQRLPRRPTHHRRAVSSRATPAIAGATAGQRRSRQPTTADPANARSPLSNEKATIQTPLLPAPRHRHRGRDSCPSNHEVPSEPIKARRETRPVHVASCRIPLAPGNRGRRELLPGR